MAAMSNRDGGFVVEDISDLSDLSETSDDPKNIKSPPSRGSLEKDANKLRSKFKILRQALLEEKLADVNRAIRDVEDERNMELVEGLGAIEARRGEQKRVAQQRKRLKLETIIKDYKSKLQEIRDEKLVSLGLSLCAPTTVSQAAEDEITRSLRKRPQARKGNITALHPSHIRGKIEEAASWRIQSTVEAVAFVMKARTTLRCKNRPPLPSDQQADLTSPSRMPPPTNKKSSAPPCIICSICAPLQ